MDDGSDDALLREIAAGHYLPAGSLFARMRALVGDVPRNDLEPPLPDEDDDEAVIIGTRSERAGEQD